MKREPSGLLRLWLPTLFYLYIYIYIYIIAWFLERSSRRIVSTLTDERSARSQRLQLKVWSEFDGTEFQFFLLCLLSLRMAPVDVFKGGDNLFNDESPAVTVIRFRWTTIGARGVVVITVGNEHGDTSSNPGRD